MIEWTLTVIVTYGLDALLVAWHNVTFIFSGGVVVVVAVSVGVTVKVFVGVLLGVKVPVTVLLGVKVFVGVLLGVTGVLLGVAVAVFVDGLQPLARID